MKLLRLDGATLALVAIVLGTLAGVYAPALAGMF